MRDVTGNFPVRSVYTLPVVSIARNAMNTSSDLGSGVGAMSSSKLVFSGFLEGFMFFRRRSRCPFDEVSEGSKYLDTSLKLMPGQVKK